MKKSRSPSSRSAQPFKEVKLTDEWMKNPNDKRLRCFTNLKKAVHFLTSEALQGFHFDFRILLRKLELGFSFVLIANVIHSEIVKFTDIYVFQKVKVILRKELTTGPNISSLALWSVVAI